MRPFDKPALSVEQQLEPLKRRGLHIANVYPGHDSLDDERVFGIFHRLALA